jgi:uncharacterized RDD family membrane protein YckC
MKCPKCRYITFDGGDRCRNCGYDFSLAVGTSELDLPIKTGDEALGPLADLDLGEPPSVAAEVEPTPAPVELEQPRARRERSAELPLFVDRGLDDDRPLVSLPAAPRAPVAVRKSTRGAPHRPATEDPALDLDAPETPGREASGQDAAVRQRRRKPDAHSAAAPAAVHDEDASTAPAGARLLGGIIDVALLAAIDVAVLYFTLRLCELEFSEAGALPIVPFVAFLALLNGGYMTAFTAAGGQSIGKMAAGTRVVNADEAAWTERVPLGQAIVRALGYIVSALPAGLGFLPAFFGADGRAVHDRIAHTRVVKA